MRTLVIIRHLKFFLAIVQTNFTHYEDKETVFNLHASASSSEKRGLLFHVIMAVGSPIIVWDLQLNQF